MSILKNNVKQLVVEYESKIQLQFALYVVVFILSMQFFFTLSDNYDEIFAKNIRAQDRIDKLINIEPESIWVKRSSLINQQLAKTQKILWPAQTQGLAEANLLGWLKGHIKTLKIVRPRINLSQSADVDGINDVMKVSLNLQASFDIESFYQLMLKIEENPLLVVITQLKIDAVRAESSRFNMNIDAYFKKLSESNNG